MSSAPKRIFISYRRSDSQWPADRLKQALAAHVADPARDIFMDVDNIPLGVNFVEYLDGQVKQCDVLLALMGQGWLNARRPGEETRRLDDPQDIVRTEIAIALRRGIPVVPVLLDDVEMPPVSMLPAELSELAQRNGVEVRRTSFDSDVARLIRGLGLVGGDSGTPAPAKSAPASGTSRPESPVKTGNRWMVPALVVALVVAGGAAWRFVGNRDAAVADSAGVTDTTTATAQSADSISADSALAVYNSSSYSFCDADVLMAHWNLAYDTTKVSIGRMVAGDDTISLDAALDSAYEAAVAAANGDHVCSYDRTPFTQQDAEALASKRQISTADAKRVVEDEITKHGRAGILTVKDWLAAAK